MAKYHITKKAVADLDSIWDYTANTWSNSDQGQMHSQRLRSELPKTKKDSE